MCCVMMHAPYAYSKLQVNNKLVPHESALCGQKEICNCMDGAEEPINSRTRKPMSQSCGCTDAQAHSSFNCVAGGVTVSAQVGALS